MGFAIQALVGRAALTKLPNTAGGNNRFKSGGKFFGFPGFYIGLLD
jgi:hypothetical protein